MSPVPAVINPAAGSARAAFQVLGADPRVRLRVAKSGETARLVAELAAKALIA